MESILASFFGLACLTWSVYIRITYTLSTTVCLDYTIIHGRALGCIGLFEYEAEEYEKKKIYQNKCHSPWYLKRGKRYKIFINKNNPHKIVAYNEYAFLLISGIIAILLALPTPIIG